MAAQRELKTARVKLAELDQAVSTSITTTDAVTAQVLSEAVDMNDMMTSASSANECAETAEPLIVEPTTSIPPVPETSSSTMTATSTTNNDISTIQELRADVSDHQLKLERLEEILGKTHLPIREKKLSLAFAGKTYLAPLTTVGNLPFRRVCKDFGVHVTCSEMAMAEQMVTGSASEWALARRHKSEDLFGLQICGGNPAVVTKACEMVEEYCEFDFVDLNCGE